MAETEKLAISVSINADTQIWRMKKSAGIKNL